MSADLNADAREAWERLRTDEILVRFIRKFAPRDGVPKGIRPRTVLDFLGEQRIVAAGMLERRYEMRGFPSGTPEHWTRLQGALGLQLLKTPPFLWTHEMRMLALEYQLPTHIIGEAAFPHRAMWWTWETALSLTTDPELGHGDAFLILRASVLKDYPKVIDFAFADGWLGFTVGSDDGTGKGAFIHLEFIVDDGTDSRELKSAAPYFSLAAFLNSHFVEVTKKRPADELKRWRGRRIGDPSSLNVVTLRSSVREAVAMERGEGPQWKQRWLVRGHLRAQWYPSLKSHKVLWIAPYLKGPEDAPLKVPVYRVAR